jgi:hypothetical protein
MEIIPNAWHVWCDGNDVWKITCVETCLQLESAILSFSLFLCNAFFCLQIISENVLYKNRVWMKCYYHNVWCVVCILWYVRHKCLSETSMQCNGGAIIWFHYLANICPSISLDLMNTFFKVLSSDLISNLWHQFICLFN